ncbi:MAG: sulfatase [Planctomycetaceae bacterium]|nr:sulfatase [Planctomycetaceae bacterium]
MTSPSERYHLNITRRHLLQNASKSVGAAALAALSSSGAKVVSAADPRLNTHYNAKAKHVIYLFFSGGPSHIDMFDYKPKMRDFHGEELPDSIRNGQRLTGMTSGQKSFPCVAPMFNFRQQGAHGTYVNEILPHIGSIADEITIIKSIHTEAINHDPAITYINTGVQQPGKPSLGAWLSYGLGNPNENLPAYVVMISKGRGQSQALYSRLWGAGFLPSRHQGVNFRSGKDPVLFLSNPEGVSSASRRNMLDVLNTLNANEFDEFGDPETEARISQYEMAFRMQTSVPGLMDVSDETEETLNLYGDKSRQPGTFARNCLLARRMVERGVRTIQLFHRGWDQHGSLPRLFKLQCEDIDQPAAALVRDLKRRGLLDETLVVCGGEFGRTIYSQGNLSKDNHGRDHHGRCFTTWLAGAGIRKGFEYGKTDDYSYNILEDPVHIRDLNATILNQIGIDHNRLTFRHQGLDQRLTGVEPARVVREILS